jgi:hypothetical protein
MTFSTYNTRLERGITFRRDFVSRFFLAPSASELLIAPGAKVFLTQASLPVATSDRIRAYSKAEPSNFMEGPIATLSGTAMTLTIDLISGDTSTPFSDWQLLASDDMTNVTFLAQMKLSPKSCAGRDRAPITLSAAHATDPKTGEFYITLTPTQTAALTLGTYDFYIIALLANGIDKRQMVRGTIEVVDPGD